MKLLSKKRSSPPVEKIRVSLSAYEQIRNTIGVKPAETGGMLGGDLKKGIITHFYYDEKASRSAVTYSPDTATVNHVLAKHWNPAGIRLIGFAHSHPNGCFQPSGGDEVYAARILSHNKEQKFLALPIIQSGDDTSPFAMRMFLAKRKGDGVRIERVRLIIVEDEDTPEAQPHEAGVKDQPSPAAVAGLDDNISADVPARRFPNPSPRQIVAPFCAPTSKGDVPETTDVSEIFNRVREAYDLRRMFRARAVYVGIGGAAGFAEDMARAGLGEQVIIDGDTVSRSNLATQQTYARDIGRPKAECVAERILDINPSAAVVTRRLMLDDIDDAEFKRLALDPLPGRPTPEVVVLCGFTDAFSAQARINRLALNLSLPSLSAQVYKEGRAAEVTFTHPDTTCACARCILSSRYKYYENGATNEVTSHGTPIFSTTRLNAIKGVIMLAIVHHSTNHPRWGPLLKRIGNRNLIQVRMDPDLESTLGIQNFSEAFRGADQKQILTDEAIWRPQLPECPAHGYPVPCPDCGGTGNLRDSAGKFSNTRISHKGKDISE